MKKQQSKLAKLNLGKELSKEQQKRVAGGNFRCAGSPMDCVQDLGSYAEEVNYCNQVWKSYPVSC